jgi:pimeloyl-ACP methyl ester carboxylesterase
LVAGDPAGRFRGTAPAHRNNTRNNATCSSNPTKNYAGDSVVMRLIGPPAVRDRSPRHGVFGNGMEYMRWGGGGKSLLYVPGGPGSATPSGVLGGAFRRKFDAYLQAGYTIWVVTRRRNMPPSHTIADMADDYARVIAEELGGRVDLVVCQSFGGMIGQYLAARHPESFRHIAMVVTGAEVSPWGKDLDRRMAAAVAGGDASGAGSLLAEYVLPGRQAWLRELLGSAVGRRVLARSGCPAADVLTEVRAELAFDARAVLPTVRTPVLLLCGGRDPFFPRAVAEETAELIPDCTLIVYERWGHVRAGSSRRVPRDVLAFVRSR